MAAATESEIAELDTYEERQEFLAEIGLQESGVSRLIRAAYSLLDLQTFFTAGSDEVRAWNFCSSGLSKLTLRAGSPWSSASFMALST